MSCTSSNSTCCAQCPTSVQSRDTKLIELVNHTYSAKAREVTDATYAQKVAEAFGYSAEQLGSIPDDAQMGLSCGNPVAIATIKEGETIVDLGSGGGIDVFLATDKVGPTGQAIGLDLSSDMIARARKNATKKNLKPPHVAFVQASLVEPLPIASETVDCVLSNCVVNLVPLDGKAHLFREVYRILKHGGRLVIDDIIAKKPLPDYIKKDRAAYVSCIAGAITKEEYEFIVSAAGLTNVIITDNKKDLSVLFQAGENASSGCSCAPVPDDVPVSTSNPDYDVNEWAGSYSIYAAKGKETTSGDGVAKVSSSVPALLRWWDAYPPAKNLSIPELTAEEAKKIMSEAAGKEGGKDGFAIVDVRRGDHDGGHVRGSYNYYAQTFYDDLPSFYETFKSTSQVIFYCQSSRGRGPRCAGWYQDYLDAQPAGSHTSKAYVLQGGIKNWLKVFQGDKDLIDGV